MIEGVHADHGDGEDHRRQGGAEEGGEESGHARGGSDAEVRLVQAAEAAHLEAQGAAHLEGRALPTGGAAAEVGEDGAQEDGGQEEEGNMAPLVDLVEDGVGALALGPEELVEAHDHQARQG